MSFFKDKQAHFFSPLSWSTREKYAYCIKAIYERLYTGEASSRRFDRAALSDTIDRALTLAPAEILPAGADEPVEAGNLEPARVIRTLDEYGWIEAYTDPAAVTRVWRLSPAGKKFARTLFETDRQPLRTRHRHMRSCAAALKNYLNRGDADDLLDSQTYAEQVVEDLSNDIEALRVTLREATQVTHLREISIEQFRHFLTERFRKEHAPRLTADSAVRLKSEILATLNAIRDLSCARLDELESELQDRVILEKGASGYLVLRKVDEIERIIANAVDAKIPELLEGFNTYISRMSSLIRQSQANATGAVDAVRLFTQMLATMDESTQDRVLEDLAHQIGISRLRLYEPKDIRFQEDLVDAEIQALDIDLQPNPESMALAEISRLFTAHLSISEEDALIFVAEEARARGGRVRLSEFPIESARALLLALSARGTVLNHPNPGLTVHPILGVADNDFFSTDDIEFRLSQVA